MIQDALIIRELNDASDWTVLYPLIRQLNNDMEEAQFQTRLRSMRAQGYRCVAAYQADALIGAAGFWVGCRFWCGNYIDLDNVVVDERARNAGAGRQLVDWIENEARRLGCSIAVLDSYTTNHSSHKFYFREGYTILGYHFMKQL